MFASKIINYVVLLLLITLVYCKLYSIEAQIIKTAEGCFTLQVYHGCLWSDDTCPESEQIYRYRYEHIPDEISLTLTCPGQQHIYAFNIMYTMPKTLDDPNSYCVGHNTSCTKESICQCCTKPEHVYTYSASLTDRQSAEQL